MADEKKLFLLDAYALIFRAYYAFIKNPRINSKGQNTSAAFGFTNALLDILNNEKPSHIAVCFDAPVQTNRQKEFSDYKANREETPEDIKQMVPYIQEICHAFNIPVIMSAGFEADDVIGTLAKKAEQHGFITYMMTPDKDFAQLVSDNIFMYKPAKGGKPAEIWGVPEVCEQFNVQNPEQVIDILGLWGDSADNIPGIPGIGEKTSKKLIAKYGSVENLIKHADEDLKGKQRENVIEFAEQGLLSKKLATIILDVPVEFDPESLTHDPPNEEKIEEIFTELEFRQLSKRVLGKEIQLPAKDESGQIDLFANNDNIEQKVDTKEFEGQDKDYKMVTDAAEIEQFLEGASAAQEFCFDTETSSLDSLQTDLVGVALSYKAHQAIYIPFGQDEKQDKANFKVLKKYLEDPNLTKIGHNIKFDIKVLFKYGITVAQPYFDTMVAHYLLEPEAKHGMDDLSELYLHYKPISIETLIGKKGKNQKSMADLDPKEIVDYACEDADITYQLKTIFAPEMDAPHLEKLSRDLEMPLIYVLSQMEKEGIRLDTEILKKFSETLHTDLIEIDEKIKKMAGVDFNLDSPKQLGEVLFEEMKITSKAKKTKSGQYSTSEDTLKKYADEHEIVPLILDYRSLRKLKNTYVDPLPDLINPETKRIHTHYMQTVAATGRLSSNNPNLQNIPIRTERGREIRKAFIPKNNDYLLLAADYSQIELRIMAALSEDKNMVDAFKHGKDIHAATASKVFGVNQDEVTREMRSQAKAVNFGIIYGQSAFGLSQNLGISRKEAKQMIDSYFEQYASIKSFMDESIEKARKNGYVSTILQRRRYLKDINSGNAIVRGFAERNAINAPIQGSAADIIKLAMLRIQEQIEKEKFQSRMLLQVHDELVFDLFKEEKESFMEMVKKEMESAYELIVPLEVDMNAAGNWLEAH